MAHDPRIRSAEFRHQRAEQLHTSLARLHELTSAFDFRDEIVARPDGIYVNVGGVLLEALSQRYYLKASGEAQGNIARAMNDVLVRRGIRPSTIVDVGANYGEVSLWFAREFPGARILAIEPVRDNRAVFEQNARAQSFPTAHVQLLPMAVMNRGGTINIQAGVSTMNRVSEKAQQGTETVPCDTLENIFAAHGIDVADFVKVDIEGAEPYLQESVGKLGPRVKAWMFEFSKFAPLQDYLDLAWALLSAGFAAYEEDGQSPLADIAAVQQHLVRTLTPREVLVTNLWFFARGQVSGT